MLLGADLIVKLLESLEVEFIFGLYGDIQTDFARAVKGSSITFVPSKNEKSAGFAADIYSRVSGKAGVVFTTLGPGSTNVMTAMANATADRSSIVCISDQVDSSELHIPPTTAHQGIDYDTVFSPKGGLTKGCMTIRSQEEIISSFVKAFQIAAEEYKGAYHVGVPKDIMETELTENLKWALKNIKNIVGEINNLAVKGPHEIIIKNQVDRLAGRIKNGKGLVLVGGSVERERAKDEFREFIEKYDLPVLCTFRGKNALAADHPQFIGTLSRHLGDAAKKLINSMDFIILVGYDYNEGVKPSLWGNKASINIEVAENRIPGVFFPKETAIGSLKAIFSFFNKEKEVKNRGFDYNRVKAEFKNIVDQNLPAGKEGYSPKRITAAVREVFNENTIFICDVGLNKYYSGLYLDSTQSNQVLFSNGQSSMAFTSGVFGAKLAAPDKNVVALVGDGGFLMNFQEILTAVEMKLPLTYIIFNNGGLGLIEQAQIKRFGESTGVRFSAADFGKLGEAFGARSFKIGPGNGELIAALKEIKNNPCVAIIDVSVDYGEITWTKRT